MSAKKDMRIGVNLKRLRIKSELNAADVTELLANPDHGNHTISQKTLYGYESGLSMPNADVFLELCKIYNVRNIIKEFGFGEPFLPDIDGKFLLSIPCIAAVYEYCSDHKKDFEEFTKYLLADENEGFLARILAGKGLAYPLQIAIENVCKANVDEVLRYNALSEEEIQKLLGRQIKQEIEDEQEKQDAAKVASYAAELRAQRDSEGRSSASRTTEEKEA